MLQRTLAAAILTVVLFTGAPLWAQKASGLIAEGYEPIVVRRTKPGGGFFEDEGVLCLLTRDKLHFRRAANSAVVTMEAKLGLVQSIRTKDGKYTWDYDPQNKVFTGTPKPVEPVNIEPLPSDPQKEANFLFLVVEQVYKDADLAAYQGLDLGPIKDAARQYAEHAQARGLPKEMIDLCTGAVELIEKRQENQAKLQELLTQFKENAEELQRRFANYRTRIFLKGLGDYLDSDGGAESLARVWLTTGGENFVATSDYLAQIQDLNKTQQDEVGKLLRQIEELRTARRNDLYRIGERFGRPRESDRRDNEKLLAKLLQNKDAEGVSKFQKNLLEREPNNPFLRAEYCNFASQVRGQDRQQKAAHMLELAGESLAAVRQVPAGRIYDRARLTLLSVACDIACRAAEKDLEGESWGEAYSPIASYAVRMLDRFFEHQHIFELDGRLREQRAWALFQSGWHDKALDEALKVQEMRKNSGTYCFNLARLYGYRNKPGDGQQAYEWLNKAVRSDDFSDIEAIRTNRDLATVRQQFGPALRKLLEPSFVFQQSGSRFVFGGSTSQDMTVTNKAAYNFTNARLTLRLVLRTGKVLNINYADEFPIIRAGETVVLKGILKEVPLYAVAKADMYLNCDQNRQK